MNCNRVVTDAQKKNGGGKFSRRIKTIITATALTLTAMTVVFFTQRTYALSLNGEIVATAKDPETIEEMISEVEEQVSDMLGYDYSMEAELEISQSLGEVEGDIEEALLKSVDEIALLYVLQIDGREIAAAETEQELRTAIDVVLGKYSDGGKASIENTVSIIHGYASKSLIKTEEEISSMLDPSNVQASCPISIRVVKEETFTRKLPYGYEYVEDDQMYEGNSEVLVEGENGISEVTESVVYLNGVEISRTQLCAITVEQSVNEITAVGTMERPYYASYGEYIWPADGIITCHFGYRANSIGSSNHRGMDIAAFLGDPIVAADGGEVICAEYHYSYGKYIKIQHDNGTVTWYAHCDELCVSVGDKVGRGQLIAYMGETGVATGVHLHFEVRTPDGPVDPLTVLP